LTTVRTPKCLALLLLAFILFLWSCLHHGIY
jgi:hypothetical protein